MCFIANVIAVYNILIYYCNGVRAWSVLNVFTGTWTYYLAVTYVETKLFSSKSV